MSTVTSRDGTIIAFDREGSGPPLILVDGALGNRGSGFASDLATRLSADMTVYTYDRRGRNESGDTQPYSVRREIEDLEALIDYAGGSAFLYGHSSGAALALEAAASLGHKIRALALYEAPYNSPAIMGNGPDDYEPTLNRLISEGHLSDAVDLFMTIVGVPQGTILEMHQAPMWGNLVSVAPTLAYDAKCMNGGHVPIDRARQIQAPTIVMNGTASAATMPFMKTTAEELAATIPNARYQELQDQRHDVDASVLAPVLADFFCSAVQA